MPSKNIETKTYKTFLYFRKKPFSTSLLISFFFLFLFLITFKEKTNDASTINLLIFHHWTKTKELQVEFSLKSSTHFFECENGEETREIYISQENHYYISAPFLNDTNPILCHPTKHASFIQEIL